MALWHFFRKHCIITDFFWGHFQNQEWHQNFKKCTKFELNPLLMRDFVGDIFKNKNGTKKDATVIFYIILDKKRGTSVAPPVPESLQRD